MTITSTKRKWWIAILGSGVALSPIHNKFLTDLATNSKGEVVFFLPAFAFVLIIVGSGFFLLNNWDEIKKVGWGDKRVTIPLLVIAGAMAISGAALPGVESKIAPAGMAASLIALYLAARVIGKGIFFPLGIGVAAASLGVFAYDASHSWTATGGYVFEENFDILAGYTILGAALFFGKYRWILSGVATLALFLSGSPEALLPLGVIAIAIMVRRDWGWKLAYVASVVLVVIFSVVISGRADSLYRYAYRAASNDKTMVGGTLPDGSAATGSPLTWRWDVIKRAMTNIKPIGEGYNATAFKLTTVHNVPLILIQQMGYPGILAALAWIWVVIYCMIKTRWKYVWLVILALSIFDHYLWDQLGPVWWAAVGASLVSAESDLIFRSERKAVVA